MTSYRIVLCGLGPRLKGLRWESDQRLRIGSAADLEISFPDPSLGRWHAEVALTGEGWVVRDQGGARGTLVNGIPVAPPGQRLHLHDVIQCGDLVLQVTTLEGESPELLTTSTSLVQIRAAMHRSWEQALDSLAPPDGPQRHQTKHLLTLLRAGYHLRHVASPEELMQAILDDLVTILEAQRGCILVADRETGRLEVRAISVARAGVRASQCYSQTLADHCFRRGTSFLCQDVSQEGALMKVDSVVHKNMASIICALLRSPRQQLGVLHLDRGPAQEPFSPEDFLLADALAASISAGVESAQLIIDERDMFLQTVTSLARAVELRDQYTGNHTQRVTQYSLLLAEELKMPSVLRQQLQMGTPLHDLGKIGIRDTILQKPGRLTAAEFEEMKTHTLKGAAMLENIPGLAPMLPIVRNHHERWDGAGYPDRLAGEAISPLARVVAVADAFDAMTTHRPYRSALSLKQALDEIGTKAGSQFAPDCARAFLGLRPRIEALVGKEPVPTVPGTWLVATPRPLERAGGRLSS